MVFSSVIFIFLFLPVVLILYRLIPRDRITIQNLFLFLVSSVFYFYGEQTNILILFLVILVNYACGCFVYSGCRSEYSIYKGCCSKKMLLPASEQEPYSPKSFGQKACMAACVIFSLGLLWYYKYFNFTLELISGLSGGAIHFKERKDIILPLGISFYTFHVLSYSLDVYFGRMRAEKNLLNFASYVLMFPQLVAGPIVRYRDICHQFYHRVVTGSGVINGVRRFCFGLSKKVLIANTLSEYADQIFAVSPYQLSIPDCWAGAVAYTLQIYFDFSGYSDMAIGLAMLFGFHYKENFNYPYIAKSCSEFWHRWHISLSTWLRDYVYIHLGGNRISGVKTARNVIFVFLCSGLWHGANFTFVCWGLLYGVCIVLENLGLKKALKKLPLLAHVYLLLVAVTGWVMFRSDSLAYAGAFIMNMYGLGPSGLPAVRFTQEIAPNVMAVMILGVALSYDWRPLYKTIVSGMAKKVLTSGKIHFHTFFMIEQVCSYLVSLALFMLSVASIVSSSHNPFIYFRF